MNRESIAQIPTRANFPSFIRAAYLGRQIRDIDENQSHDKENATQRFIDGRRLWSSPIDLNFAILIEMLSMQYCDVFLSQALDREQGGN